MFVRMKGSLIQLHLNIQSIYIVRKYLIFFFNKKKERIRGFDCVPKIGQVRFFIQKKLFTSEIYLVI